MITTQPMLRQLVGTAFWLLCTNKTTNWPILGTLNEPQVRYFWTKKSTLPSIRHESPSPPTLSANACLCGIASCPQPPRRALETNWTLWAPHLRKGGMIYKDPRDQQLDNRPIKGEPVLRGSLRLLNVGTRLEDCFGDFKEAPRGDALLLEIECRRLPMAWGPVVRRDHDTVYSILHSDYLVPNFWNPNAPK